ncbi:hypothetical protein [Rummeliibacillus suwonensis]|uniref:hypothetical protein n=1 Tax=Rummeliibacillus suwonensis TaxID=1306154 RepID=UPI00289BB199|nr:hypothetical protein [Rummeliibacillus suwonensis]
MKRPIGVTLISYLSIFGIAALISTTLFFNQIANKFGFAEKLGLSDFPEELFRVLLAIVTLIIIYGYMNLKPWGFWLMVSYCISLGTISYLIILSNNKRLFIGNFVWSSIVFIYSIAVHKSFFNEKHTQKIKFVK